MKLQKTTKSTKLPKCKICKKEFVRIRALQQVCSYQDSPDCAKEFAKQKSIKDGIKEASIARIEHRKAKEKVKTRGEYVKEAQNAFNKFIRCRDGSLPCISCGRHHTGQYHAGHYRTTAAAPELRFNELNVWKQCAPCNNHKHGNITEYRINLVKRIGVKAVEWLEGPHEPAKYTIEELKEIKKLYNDKVKELQKTL